MATKIKTVTPFGRYAFADSITVKGDFSTFSVVDKKLVRNCNFEFISEGKTRVLYLDHMFEGCENASFTSRLSIPHGSIVTTATAAFKDCKSALLPSVDIGESEIVTCDRMFENCTAASLCGVQIPSGATKFDGMFHNAKSAFFNEISAIPNSDNYRELFSGCESGVFQNLTFGSEVADDVDCGFMFYYCGSLDCDNLNFERVSKHIANSEYMFYAAGRNGSGSFDDGIYDFSSLDNCEHMFTNSNFSFNRSYFRFDGMGDMNVDMTSKSSITSISEMFSGCKYCGDTSPVVIIGNLPDGRFELSSIDEKLNHRLNGHYGSRLMDCILDFSSLYEGSSFSTLDMRGISNNGNLAAAGLSRAQDFTAMCRDCKNLKRIVGYLPQCAKTYDHMFSGCSSLSAELPSLFRVQPTGWENMSQLEEPFHGDDVFKSYSMTSMRGTFSDCAFLYSTKDNFDLVGLFRTIERNLGTTTLDAVAMVKDMMPPTRIATGNPIPGLGSVRYIVDDVSSSARVIKYNSSVVESAEMDNIGHGAYSNYGIYSDYARSAFGSGFYRYGGEFLDGSGMRFFIIFKPMRNDITDKVEGFYSDTTSLRVGLMPHGWKEKFNTDRSRGYWNEFEYDKLYPGFICGPSGNFIRFAYIGEYTRVYHEYRGNSTDGKTEYVSRFVMPVTYFDGCEDEIAPL